MLSSLFASRAYYAFGFLALTAGVVSLTTATVTILFTYFLLCAEEYRYVYPAVRSVRVTDALTDGIGVPSSPEVVVPSGCWRMAFSTGRFVCLWIPFRASCSTWATFSCWHFWTSLSQVCAYVFVVDTRLILHTGTIGFLATYWAVRRLYSAIRID